MNPFKRQRKLRNYIINKNFQLSFILHSFIPTFFCFITSYCALVIYFSEAVNDGVSAGLPPEHAYFTLIANQKILLNYFFLINGTASLMFFIIWGIFISHKIAGPLYRLTRFFADGDASNPEKKLSFRPGDFFQEIPDTINKWREEPPPPL